MLSVLIRHESPIRHESEPWGELPPHPPVGGRPASPEPPPKGLTVGTRGRFALPPRRVYLSSRTSFTNSKRSPIADRSRINLHGSRPMRSDLSCPQSNPSGGGVGGRSRPLTGGLGVFPQGSDSQTFGMINILSTSSAYRSPVYTPHPAPLRASDACGSSKPGHEQSGVQRSRWRLLGSGQQHEDQ